MFKHVRGVSVSRQEELEADYMARAILMPLGTMSALMDIGDYENLSVEDKKRFARYVSERFQVPIQHAVLRIREVRVLQGKN